MAKRNLLLPEEFEKIELSYFDISYDKGNEILGYCKTCVKKSDCNENHILRQAMGENFPFWSENFVGVNVPDPNGSFFDSTQTKVFCENYEHPQMRLSGVPRLFSDGVERLQRMLEIESEKAE